jgi:hypothetical protein
MTPLPAGALQHLLKTLPPERQDPFPHLANLSPDALLRRRARISQIAKRLEQERQAIDANLLEVFSDAELRFGVRAAGGWVLKSRSRTSWDYAPEIKETIKGIQQQAQRDGLAKPLVSTFLVATQESAQASIPSIRH